MALSFEDRLKQAKENAIRKDLAATAQATTRLDTGKYAKGSGKQVELAAAKAKPKKLIRAASDPVERKWMEQSQTESRWGFTPRFGADTFGTWANGVTSFSKQFAADYTKRKDSYQSQESLKSYKDQTDARVKAMQEESQKYRKYFEDNRDRYGDEQVSKILAELDDTDAYLNSVSDSLASEAAYWNQWESEDAYNEYNRIADLDITAAQKNISLWESQVKLADEKIAAGHEQVQAYNNLGMTKEMQAAQAELEKAYADKEQLEKQISDAHQDMNAAKQLQQSTSYYNLMSEPDFAEYAKKGAEIKNPTYQEVQKSWKSPEKIAGNIVEYYRDNWNSYAGAGAGSGATLTEARLYNAMTEDEVSVYNYLLAKEGKEPAAKYLQFLRGTLNARLGSEMGERLNALPGWAKAPALGVFSLQSGLDQFASGVAQIVSPDETRATSPIQVASQVVQEDLGKVGKTLYSAGTTVGNMLPSILVGVVSGGLGASGAVSSALGSATLGTSSAGNAYNQALQEGYSREQAMTYGKLVGASEAVLQYALGGISALGGIPEEKLLAKVAGFDKALSRLAATGAIKLGSEITEEELQLWLEPLFKSKVLFTDYEAPTTQEMWETALVTALSTGLLEGGNIAGVEINYAKYGDMVLQTQREQEIVGEAMARCKHDGAAYKLAMEIEADRERGIAPSSTDIGRLAVLKSAELGETTTVAPKATTETTTEVAADTAKPKKKAPVVSKEETDRLLNQSKSEDADTANYAAAQLAHEGETVVSPIAQKLMDTGMKAADAVEQAALIMKVQSGQQLTNAEGQKLNLVNESVRTAFTEATGIAVTEGQARIASQKRQIFRSAAEVKAAQNKVAEAEKAQADASAAAEEEAAVVQQVEQQQARATYRDRAESVAAALLENQVAQEEAARQADSVEYADGTKQTREEFVADYMAQYPNASEEEAVRTFEEYKLSTGMGQPVPETARPVNPNAPAKRFTDRSPESRSSVGEAKSTIPDAEGRTEAGRAMERELTLRELNRIAGKYGVSVEVQDPDGVTLNENENGFYDSSAKKIILNSKKATNQFTMTYYFVHELTHHGQIADGDVETGLTSDIIGAMEKIYDKEAVEKLLKETRARYENHFKKTGKDLSALDEPNYIEDEVAADFMMKAIGNRSLLDTLAGVTLKPHQALIRNVKNFLSGKKSTDVGYKEAERLIKRMQESMEAAQKQGLKNLEDRSRIGSKKREVRNSVERNEESTDYRERQDSGRTGTGSHGPENYRRGASSGVLGRGNLGRHESLVIPEETRRIMDDKGIPDIGLSETDDRSAFSVALDAAKAANPNGGMVDSQSVEGLTESGARTFMRSDGGAGVAVEADGNIVGVFKNPNIVKAGRTVYDLLYTALAQGGNHLDCYATYARHDLSSKYTQFGFEPVAWMEFNREYAPDDWNYEAWGEPDVVMWVHNGDTVEQIVGREEPYRVWTKDDIHALPKFEDYDEAKAHQKAELEKRKVSQSSSKRYSIDPEFASDVDEWVASGKPDDWTLTLGSTGGVLQGLGAVENDIYILSDKMNQIISDHPEMGLEEIKKLPQVLEDPVLILNSKNKVAGNARIIVFGQYKAANGRPLLGVLDLRPVKNGIAITDMQKLTSAYTKTGTEDDVKYFFNASDVLYADEKRAAALLRSVGFSMPTELQRSGFLGSIAYNKRSVNIKGVPFGEILPEQTDKPQKRLSIDDEDSSYRKLTPQQQEYFKDSKIRDPFGRLKRMYHGTSSAGFTVFDIAGSNFGLFGQGAYFTDDPNVAESYQKKGRGETPGTYEVYLNITNPLDMDAPIDYDMWFQMLDHALLNTSILEDAEKLETNEDGFRALLRGFEDYGTLDWEVGENVEWLLRNFGFDGIVHVGGGRYGTKDGAKHVVAIAFDQEQIKRIDNTAPTTDPDIRYSIDPTTGYEEGSTEDKVLKLLRAGSKEDAIAHLERWVKELEEGKIDPATVESTLKDAYFKARPLTPQQRAENSKKLDDLIARYGAIKPGAVQRDKNGKVVSKQVFLPNRVRDTKGVSDFARTLAEDEKTPEWFRDEIERAIADEMSGYTYDIATDKAAMQYIKGRKQVSFEHNLRTWENIVEYGIGGGSFGGISKNDIALGEYIYTEAVKAGDVEMATKVAAELAAVGTAAGQVVQAMSLLKKMTPSGKLYYLSRTIDRLNSQYQKKIDAGKMSKIKYDKDLAAAVLNAKTTEEAQKAMEALLQDVANQIPPTLMERWNAWRYLSMLGNTRTHIRNILSNVVFAPVTFIKDIAGLVPEVFLSKDHKTKNLLGALSSAAYAASFTGVKLGKYVKFADTDYQAMKDVLRGGGKYNPADLIRDKRAVFKSKALNKIGKANSAALEAEDALFLKEHYVRALSQYLAAQKADVASLTSTPEGRNLLAKARSWAVSEAQKATFRDASALASALSKLERSGIAGQLIVGGVMPFKKTPVNILKRGAEYSPLGIINTVAQMTKGKENAAKTLDALSSTLTGSALMYLGYALARWGLLFRLPWEDEERRISVRATGSGDEKEREFEELQGAQPYALVLDDGSNFTLDWVAPAALPLFVGAQVYETFAVNEEFTAADFADTLMLIAEPMFQLSMLDGLNNTLTAAGYSDNPLSAVMASTLTSYIGQAVPTVFGQIARTMDDTRRTTYIDKNRDTIETLDRTVQYNMTKLPGASKKLAPKLDAWGRADTEQKVWLRAIENAILPGYVSKMTTTPMEDELKRLYKATGETGVLPKAVPKHFKVDSGEDRDGDGQNEKVRHDLTADEWVTYQTEAGQGAYELLTRLVNSEAYQGLTDSQKAEAVQKAFSYANEKGKAAAVEAYQIEDTSWIAKADKLADSGFSVEDFIVQTLVVSDSDANNTQDILNMEWLNDEDKALLISSSYGKQLKGENGNSFSDPNRSGYLYTMTEEQTNQYIAHYDALWSIEFDKLINGRKYLYATTEEKTEMVNALRGEVANDTKKWMARQLRQSGVRSTRND